MKQITQENSVRSVLKQGIARLREAHVPSFTLAAELLLLHMLGRDRTWLYAHPEELISEEDARRYFSLIERRSSGEPTQHLTGKQEFWGLEFEVSPDVLIPRPETEHVVEVALDRLGLRERQACRPQKTSGEGLRIADVGTGSGCIAIALAKELPGASFFATDISAAALEMARRNAARHNVIERIRFVECNLLEYATGSIARAQQASPLQETGEANAVRVPGPGSLFFDLIVSNPPYVGRREFASLMREVREHEPEVALYGGEEGYELYAELVAQSQLCLKAEGILVLELGHNGLPAVQPLLDASHWTNVGVTNDLAGIPRVISAERL